MQRFFRVGLARIAVPYFFGISGFLIAGKINPENYKNEIFKRIRSLLIPFWFWGFFFVCLRYVLFFIYERKERNIFPSELYPSLALLVTWIGVKPSDTLSILWFLRTLFFFVCFSPVIIHAIKILQYKLIVILWMLFVCWKMIGGFIFPGINSFFEYGLSLSGICAFSLGLCIRMYGFHLPHVIKYVCIAMACVLWSVTWIVVEYFGLRTYP